MYRWSAIATHLPKRTDNEIKNYWNTHLKKRLTKMGIDPVTHKPKNNALDLLLGSNSQYSKHTHLNHMAQWENARLEAEARLVKESKMTIIPSSSSSSLITPRPRLLPPPPSLKQQPLTVPPCLDILKAWHKQWTTTINSNLGALESPTSVFNFSSDHHNNNNNNNHHMMTMISSNNNNVNDVVQPYPNMSQEIFECHDQNISCVNNKMLLEEEGGGPSFLEGLGEDLLTDNDVDQVFNNMINEFNDHDHDNNNFDGCYDSYYYNFEDDDNKYWNSIL